MKQPEDVIIKGFQEGIGDSPHVGFEDIRNLDILGSPGSMSLNFALAALDKPPTVSALAYTTTTATDLMTVSSTSGWYNGMAIILDTVVTSTGISTGRVYWVGDLTATTFKLYKSPALTVGSLVDITGSDGSGTLSSYTISAPLDKAIFYSGTGSVIRPYIFILDDTGKVWWVKNDGGTLTNDLVYLGNDTLTGTTGRAIAVHSQDIVVFRTSTFDTLNCSDIEAGTDLDSGSGWVYGVDTISSVSQTRRAVLAGQDGILYFNNDNRIGSLDDSYVKNTSALDLPASDEVESIGELGQNLLIGTTRNYIYPWDRSSDSFGLPIILPESKVSRIVTANQFAFLFAGNRGRIYVTNGTSVELFKKFPDHLTGAHEPYYSWGDALTWRNQLYFSFTATNNAGTTLTTTGGIWGIDIASRALRYTHQPSYGSYAGSVTVLLPNILSDTPAGSAIYAGWSNSGSYGVDTTATTYATSYAAYAISPLIQVGGHLSPRTFEQAEILLDKELASGEGVKVSARVNRTDSFSTAVTLDFSTQGAVNSANLVLPVTDAQLLQAKIEVTGSTTTPSIREVRLR